MDIKAKLDQNNAQYYGEKQPSVNVENKLARDNAGYYNDSELIEPGYVAPSVTEGYDTSIPEFRALLDASSDPIGLLSKMHGAQQIAANEGIDFSQAYDQFKNYSTAYYGQDLPEKTFSQMMADNWKAGIISNQLGVLKMDQRYDKSPELAAKISELEAQTPPEGYWDSHLSIPVLKDIINWTANKVFPPVMQSGQYMGAGLTVPIQKDIAEYQTKITGVPSMDKYDWVIYGDTLPNKIEKSVAQLENILLFPHYNAQVMNKVIQGTQYDEMIKAGVNDRAAFALSGVSSLIQLAMETAGMAEYLGVGMVNAVTQGALKDALLNRRFLKAALTYFGTAAVEGAEEGGQYVAEVATKSLGTAIERLMPGGNRNATSPMDKPEQVFEEFKQNIEGGFNASLFLGIPAGISSSRASTKQFKQVADLAASAPTAESFVKIMNTEAAKEKFSEIFEGVSPEAKDDYYTKTWLANQAEKGAPVTTEEAAPKEYATNEAGLVYTEKKVTAEYNDGATAGILKFGDETTAESYGYAEYRTAPDGSVTLDRMNLTKPGMESDAYRSIAAQFPGIDIQHTPETGVQAEAWATLSESNPRGADKGIQQYDSAESLALENTRESLRGKLKTYFPKMDSVQRETALIFMDNLAKGLGMDTNAYLQKTFHQGIIGNEADLVGKLEEKGKALPEGYQGATDFEERIKGDVKALIYIGGNGDFSTWIHENAHVYQNNLTGEMKTKAETAFGVTNGNWKEINPETNRMRAEDFAYGLEDYLRTGKAPSLELKNIYDQIAKIMVDLYNGLKSRMTLSPEIVSVYEEMLGKPTVMAAMETKQAGPVSQNTKTVEKTTDKPAEVPTASYIPSAAVMEVPLDDITLMPENLNFKEGADPKTGVVEKLAGEKYLRFPEAQTNPIMLMRRKAGNLEVITGRHRLDLARRTGEKTIPAQIIDESDNFTANDAIMFDLESNIRDGQGTVKDYANIFRFSDYTREQASSRGLLDRDKGRKGFSIGKYASDNLYTLYRNGGIGDSKAAAIAEAAQNRPDLQDVGIKEAKNLPADELFNLMYLLKQQPASALKSTQLDLAGMEAEAPIMIEQKLVAKVGAKHVQSLKDQKAALANYSNMSSKTLSKADEAKLTEYGFKPGDIRSMKHKIALLDADLEQWTAGGGHGWMTDPVMMGMIRQEAGLPSAVTAEEIQKREDMIELAPEEEKFIDNDTLDMFAQVDPARNVRAVAFKFPDSVKGYSDIHSQAQLPADMNIFGRGVINPKTGEVIIGQVGSSHVALSKGITDAKRFYFGFGKTAQTAYVVAKNSMDEAAVRESKNLQMILSNVFDKYKLGIEPGTKIQIQNNTGPLFQQDPAEIRLAPNGERSNLNEKQWAQVRTPAFKAWFGDWENDSANASKVVDENGEPMVVYHGTDKYFEVFSSSEKNKNITAGELSSRKMFWFASNKYVGNKFANGGISAYGESVLPGNYLKEVYINIRSPSIIDMDKVVITEQEKGYIVNHGFHVKDEANKKEITEIGFRKEAEVRMAIKNGADGIIFKNGYDGPAYRGDILGAFSPSQIKSATANAGTFDAGNDSILFQQINDDEFKAEIDTYFEKWKKDADDDGPEFAEMYDWIPEQEKVGNWLKEGKQQFLQEFFGYLPGSIEKSKEVAARNVYIVHKSPRPDYKYQISAFNERDFGKGNWQATGHESMDSVDKIITTLLHTEPTDILFQQINDEAFKMEADELIESIKTRRDTPPLSEGLKSIWVRDKEKNHARVQRQVDLVESLKNGVQQFGSPENESYRAMVSIVHKSTRPEYKYQVSHFTDDKYQGFIPIGHNSVDAVKDIIREITLFPMVPTDVLFQTDTDTPEFKAWFKDSKVVNEDGSPKKMFHGTAAVFESFSVSKAQDKEGRARGMGWGKGKFYFTESNLVAQDVAIYAKIQGKGKTPNVISAYLKIENPISAQDYQGHIAAGENRDKSIAAYDKWLISQGIDGIIDETTGAYAVFSPSQIKSVNNTGAWSPADDRIMFQEENEPLRAGYPKVRGGWTEDKIIKALKSVMNKPKGTYNTALAITQFDNAQDLFDHTYYHGTSGFIGTTMKPSITFSDKKAEQVGGGGYGDKYWGISLSKSKRTAEGFSGSASLVNVYPVILDKRAKVIEMPDVKDAADVEEYIVQLWTDEVDAVWIGGGEQELLILNPKAITVYKKDDSYYVYGGFKSEEFTIEKAQQAYDQAKGIVEAGRPVKGAAELDRIMFQTETDRSPWIYKSEQVIRDKLNGVTPGANILSMLRGAGVKEEEIKWTGLDDYLSAGEKRSPKEVIDFIHANKLHIDEVKKSGPVNFTNEDINYKGIERATDTFEGFHIFEVPGNELQIPVIRYKTEQEARRYVLTKEKQYDNTKFSTYTLQGGKNYREVLFTLPIKETPESEALKKYQDELKANGFTKRSMMSDEQNDKLAELNIAENNARLKHPKPFTGPHWSEDNVVAHTRLADRTTAENGNMLFIEEIQSDWHQKGRREGYETGARVLPNDATAEEGSGGYWHIEQNGYTVGEGLTEKEAIDNYFDNQPKGISDAPFKKTWHEFVFKRILKEATTAGYDSIGWTAGQEQADRYSLEKHIKQIGYEKKPDGKYNVAAYSDTSDDSSAAWDVMGATIQQVEEEIGKDLAQKIERNEGRRAENGGMWLEGIDLKTGGEGMKGFYDKILVDYANKYGKKWGAKVEDGIIETARESFLPDGKPESIKPDDYAGYTIFLDSGTKWGSYETKEQAQAVFDRMINSFFVNPVTVHTMKITPEMREAVGQGQILFQLSDDNALASARDFASDGKTREEWISYMIFQYEDDLAGTPDVKAWLGTKWEAAQTRDEAPTPPPAGKLADPEDLDEEISRKDREALADTLENPELAEEFRSGNNAYSEKQVNTQDEELNALRARLAESEARTEKAKADLSAAQAEAVETANKLYEVKLQYDSIEKKVAARIKKRLKIGEDLTAAQANALKSYQTLTAKMEKTDEATRMDPKVLKEIAEGAQEIDTREKIRVTEEIKKDLKAIRAYKKKLGEAIMKPATMAIHWEERQAIAKIQAGVDPNYRSERITWEGEKFTLGELQSIIDNDPHFLETIKPADRKRIEKALTRRSLGEIKVSEIEDIYQDISNLKKTGRMKRKLALEIKRQRRERAIFRIETTLRMNKRFSAASATGSLNQKDSRYTWDRFVQGQDILNTNMRRIARDDLDGGADGENVRQLTVREREAFSAEKAQSDRRLDAMREIMKELGVKPSDLYREVEIPGYFNEKGEVMKFTADDLLYVYIGRNNEQTRAAIAYGNLLNSDERKNEMGEPGENRALGEERFALLSDAVDSILTDNEKLLADAIGKDFQEAFERANIVASELFNAPLEAVDHYVPMMRLDWTGDSMEATIRHDLLESRGGSVQESKLKSNTEKGFTYVREDIAPEHQRPIRLGLFDSWTKSVDTTEHFIAYTEYIQDLNVIYKESTMSEGLRYAIDQTYGPALQNYVNSYISEMSSPEKITLQNDLDKVLRWARGKLGPAYLGLKLSTVLKQAATNPWYFLPYMNSLQYADAAKDIMLHPSLIGEIRGKSAIFRHRSMNQFVEEMKIAKKKGIEGPWAKFTELEMAGLQAIDMATVAPGWLAAYRDALKTFSKYDQGAKKIPKKMEYFDSLRAGNHSKDESSAIQYADDIMNKVQPSGRKAELSPYMKGNEAFKTFTIFQTQLNLMFGNITHDIPEAVRNKEIGRVVGQVAAFAISGIAYGLCINPPDWDDEGDVLLNFLTSAFINPYTDTIPWIGSMVTAAAEALTTGETPFLFHDKFLPAVDTLGEAVNEAVTGDWEKALRKTLDGALLVTGGPYSGIKELEAVADIGPTAFLGWRK